MAKLPAHTASKKALRARRARSRPAPAAPPNPVCGAPTGIVEPFAEEVVAPDLAWDVDVEWFAEELPFTRG